MKPDPTDHPLIQLAMTLAGSALRIGGREHPLGKIALTGSSGSPNSLVVELLADDPPSDGSVFDDFVANAQAFANASDELRETLDKHRPSAPACGTQPSQSPCGTPPSPTPPGSSLLGRCTGSLLTEGIFRQAGMKEVHLVSLDAKGPGHFHAFVRCMNYVVEGCGTDPTSAVSCACKRLPEAHAIAQRMRKPDQD